MNREHLAMVPANGLPWLDLHGDPLLHLAVDLGASHVPEILALDHPPRHCRADLSDPAEVANQLSLSGDGHPTKLEVVVPGLDQTRQPRVTLEVPDLLGATIGPERHPALEHHIEEGAQVWAAVRVDRGYLYLHRLREEDAHLLLVHAHERATSTGHVRPSYLGRPARRWSGRGTGTCRDRWPLPHCSPLWPPRRSRRRSAGPCLGSR